MAVCAHGASDERFQVLGTNFGLGLVQDSVIGPGPTPGSQRLYLDYAYAGYSLDLVAIDPDSGSFQVFQSPVKGEIAGYKMVVGPDGNLYMGTAPHGHVLRLETATGEFTDLGRPSTSETYIWELAVGADGMIYGCTYPSAKLVRVDPASGALADLGRMDSVENYGRFIAASNDGFLYIGIGYDKQHLVAYQISSGTHQDILLPQYQLRGVVTVHRGNDGNAYAQSKIADGPNFLLSGFTATAINASAVKPATPRNVLADGRTITYGADFIRVRGPAPGQTATLPYEYAGGPLLLFRIGLGPDGMLYGSTELPANLVTADPVRGNLATLGDIGSGEAYSFLPQGGRLLIAAYSGRSPLMSYDPLERFSPAGSNGNPTLVNYAGEDPGWRPQSMIAGPQGKIYIGAVAGYGTTMGPLTVWDPGSNQVSSYALYSDQSVVSVATAGNYVTGGTSIGGSAGSHSTANQTYLFLWDPAAAEKVFETIAVPGPYPIYNLATARDGSIFGISASTFFVFDPKARQVTYTAKLPFSGVLPSTLNLGPDGNFWGLTSSGIFTINAATRQATLVATAPEPITAGWAMDTNSIYFASNAVLYRYHWSPLAVVSAASGFPALAPDSYASIYGSNLDGSSSVTITDLNGKPHSCELVSVSSGQISFVVPPDVPEGIGSLAVAGVSSPIQIAAVAPGLFTANGDGAGAPAAQIIRIAADGTRTVEPVAQLNRATNQYAPLPIAINGSGEHVYLILYGTGIRNRSALSAVTARANGADLPVTYAGPQDEYAALDQINVSLVPELAGSGNITLRLYVDGISANPVALLIP